MILKSLSAKNRPIHEEVDQDVRVNQQIDGHPDAHTRHRTPDGDGEPPLGAKRSRGLQSARALEITYVRLAHIPQPRVG